MRFKHNLSHTKLTSMDMGKLVPIGCVEVLPGDTVQHSTKAVIRVSPLVAPVMHPVVVRIHHWFVPHRLVWTDAGGVNTGFEAFITGGPAGTSVPTHPTITFNNVAVGSLADYLDVPSLIASNRSISALPFRAYAYIYNSKYRDQDLVTALTIDKTDGVDTTTNTTLQSIAWEKDRFTSARLTTQKGTAVSLPLGSVAPVITTGANPTFTSGADSNISLKARNEGGVGGLGRSSTWTADDVNAIFGNVTGLQADLSTATAADINDLRWAIALQSYKESRLLYGSRYVDYLNYLGIRCSDARLQEPEYLGGGKQTIQFSEVLSTATDLEDSNPIGTPFGHGIAAMQSNNYRRFFEEHGYVITLMSVRPKSIYGNGIPKHLLRTTKEDYWQKELQFVGQAEVYNQEVYSGDTGPTDVFGYQDRYDEYRREESRVSAEFRTTALNHNHLARLFAGDVTLNASFITCDPAESRILASTATDSLRVMAHHKMFKRSLVAPSGVPKAL